MCRSQYARTSSIVATPDNIARRASRSRTGSPQRTFDVLVVGGGIYGLTIAYDAAAARRCRSRSSSATISAAAAPSTTCGRSTAACATCSTSNVARARESVRERRTLARIAPHAVDPLPLRAAALPIADQGHASRCAPACSSTGSSPPAATAACAPSLRLPAGRVVSRQQAIEQFPGPAPPRADRRRRLARLRRARSRSADVQLGARGRRPRRGARQPRRSRQRGAKRDGASRASHASIDSRAARFEIAAQDSGQCDRRRHRSPARLGRHLDRHPDAQGDEPGHDARGRRRRAWRTIRVGPQSVPGSLAAPGAVRHLGVADGLPPGPGVADRGGGRLVHRRAERGVSGARSERSDVGAGPSRRRTRRRDIETASRWKGVQQVRDHAGDGVEGLSQRRRARSTRPHAPSPSRSSIACSSTLPGTLRVRAARRPLRCQAATCATSR